MLNDRAQILLKALIERYIADGQPVASRALAAVPGLELSPASIRNIMADLEDMGLIVSPHTSAGRVPTARGYRLFVDNLLTMSPPAADEVRELEHSLQPDSPQKLARSASSLLSGLTRFAGVVMTPRRADVAFRQVDFLQLSERRVLLILVTLDGDVQNHLLTTRRNYSSAELHEAAAYLNSHFAGEGLSGIMTRLEAELSGLQSNISELMAAAIRFGRDSQTQSQDALVISGGSNLLSVRDLSDNMTRLRELFGVFEQKTDLLTLLSQSCSAQGVSIFIGEESGVMTLDECSVVTAPYRIDGNVVGTLGVIGPTRMDYERVIPIVDITARLVSSALSHSES